MSIPLTGTFDTVIALTGTFDTVIALTGTVGVYEEVATGTPIQWDFTDTANTTLLAVL